MKINTKVKKILIVLVVSIITLMSSMYNVIIYATTDNNTLKIEKISNPDAGEGQVDGLVEGGDRETSYAWAMAQRGDYLYIGTNKNILRIIC